jgi:hypothetical protein
MTHTPGPWRVEATTNPAEAAIAKATGQEGE